MAWITINFPSNVLHMPVEAEILLPQVEQRAEQQIYKVLILLHGVGQDRTEWLMKSQIYDMVKDLPILVCMPSGKNSFFINTANGYHYMDYIIKELPDLLKKMFPVSYNRENWMIAGASIGGYSALLCGLHNPKQFGYLASFGGILDIRKGGIHLPEGEMELIFGKGWEAKEEEKLFYLCDNIAKADRPCMMMVCGRQDSWYKENLCFYQKLKEKCQVTWIEGDGGHDFIYWNQHLREVLEWFLREDKKEDKGV